MHKISDEHTSDGPRPNIVIYMDQLNIQLNPNLWIELFKYGIEPMFFAVKTSQDTQPLDNGPNGAIKNNCRKQKILTDMGLGTPFPDKLSAAVFAVMEALTPEVIMKGWERTGLYPPNVDLVVSLLDKSNPIEISELPSTVHETIHELQQHYRKCETSSDLTLNNVTVRKAEVYDFADIQNMHSQKMEKKEQQIVLKKQRAEAKDPKVCYLFTKGHRLILFLTRVFSRV